MFQCVAVWCIAVQCVAVRCSVLQRRGVLQYAVVRCSVLQCVAVGTTETSRFLEYCMQIFTLLLCFIDPRVRKITNEASSCPGIFSSDSDYMRVSHIA